VGQKKTLTGSDESAGGGVIEMADFAYDAGNPETIDRSEEKTITVTGGCPPFIWTVAGTGFTLQNSTTIGRTNALIADATACGMAAMTVTDTWSDIAAYVRALLAEPRALLFGDHEIENWKKQACMDISSKALCYETSDLITLVENQLEYAKPSGCIKIYACLRGGPGWIQHFDNTNWETYPLGMYGTDQPVWDGSQWVFAPENPIGDLDELGTWVESYRPTKIRLTIAAEGGGSGPFVVALYDTNDDVLVGDADYTSLDELTITWGDYDIGYLSFEAGIGGYEITNIEFYITTQPDKGLMKIHPRQVGHASEMKSGPPEFYYDFAGRLGFYPVCDAANAGKNVTVLFSRLTDDICNIPIEYRLYAVLYVLYRALIKARKYASARIIVKIYLRNLLFQRQDLYERGVDTREMMKLLDK